MTLEAKIKWTIVWIVLSPLIVLSWIAAVIIWPLKKVVDFINKLRSP